jgi:DNA-binding response OmpR family regulator
MRPMTTVLVVDDQPDIVRLVRDYLERTGFQVLTAGDGEQALQVARRSHPDLVILDLSVPKLDGLDVARALRRDGDLPIIMLTARTEESDRVAGLELGADDYVTKPFSAREMVARVRAVLRRTSGAHTDEDIVRVGDILSLDVPRMETTVDGRQVALTPTEFQLLLHMARQPGRVAGGPVAVTGGTADGAAEGAAVTAHPGGPRTQRFRLRTFTADQGRRHAWRGVPAAAPDVPCWCWWPGSRPWCGSPSTPSVWSARRGSPRRSPQPPWGSASSPRWGSASPCAGWHPRSAT